MEIIYAGGKVGVIGKAVVLQSNKNGKCECMGVAVSGDMMCNFKFQYDWPVIEETMLDFLDDLRHKLAEGLDIAPSQMDLRERELLGLLKEKWEMLHPQGMETQSFKEMVLQ